MGLLPKAKRASGFFVSSFSHLPIQLVFPKSTKQFDFKADGSKGIVHCPKLNTRGPQKILNAIG